MNQHFNHFPPCVVRYVPDDELPQYIIDGIEYKTSGRALDTPIPTIEIADSHVTDVGLREHEFEHVRQRYWLLVAFLLVTVPLAWWAMMPFWWAAALSTVALGYIGISLHGYLRDNNRAYRQHCEVEAYKLQMTLPNKYGRFLTREDAALALACPKYRLDISYDRAFELLG